jgi:iron complex outermembrane receptor protein
MQKNPSSRKFSPCTRIATANGKVTFTLGGTNLTDKRYVTTGQPQIAGGVIFGTYNPPREWYATLGMKY